MLPIFSSSSSSYDKDFCCWYENERWKMKVPFCHRFEDLLPSRRVVTSQGYLIFWKNIWKTFLLWNCYFGVEREKRTICFRLNNRFKFGHHSIQRDTLLRDTDQIKSFTIVKCILKVLTKQFSTWIPV